MWVFGKTEPFGDLMTGKLYEVVDGRGELTGERVTAREARERKLGLRFAQVFLFNPKGEMLVQQRPFSVSARPNLLDPSAAGHVEIGQSYEECAHMEMWEEIGVKTKLTKMFGYSGHWGWAEVFRGEWDGKIVPAPEEVQNYAWLPLGYLDEVMRLTPWLASDGFVSSYVKFREGGGGR